MTGPVARHVASHLPEMAALQPGEPAVIVAHRRGWETVTFRELDEESAALAGAFSAAGLADGARVILMVRPSRQLFALTFGLLKAGAVPVLIDPGLGLRSLGEAIGEARPRGFVGVPAAHAARVALGWGRGSLERLVTVGPRLGWGGERYEDIVARGRQRSRQPPKEVQREALAAVLFTSGSTGPAKGVLYTHGMFAAQVEALRALYDIRPGERDVSTFPLFALFGPALGMTAIVPFMDASRPASADPRRIHEAITRWSATSLFGSPALVDRLGRFGVARGLHLASLRRVISAGAPVHPAVLERMARLLPRGAHVHTPYGATECLPVATISSEEVLSRTRALTASGSGVCVGRIAPDMAVRILRIEDGPLPDCGPDVLAPAGEVGEIAVSGPVVSAEYLARPEATRLHKARDPATGALWHRTGDLGRLDDTGRLWMCGRKSHRVATAGKLLFSVACEGIFNEVPGVRRSALVGVGAHGAQRPVLCVEPERRLSRAARRSLATSLLERARGFPQTASIERILFHPSFPVDIRHNAKIFREKLALWAQEQLR